MAVTQEEQKPIEHVWRGTINRWKARVFCPAIFFAVVACTYLQWCPHSYRSFKVEDSGLFLHVGQRLAQGDVLYRDISDNKPPVIYWLNEAGLRLAHGSPAGVLLLCLAAGLLTFAILYWGLRHYVGWELFIIAGCLSQLEFLTCALHPNYTESFALPLIALSAVLLVRELLGDEKLAWYAPAQGVIAALLFSLRANNIAICFIYALYLLLNLRRNGRFRQLCYFALASVGVYALVLTPLALQGTIPDYVNNVFRLAGAYTGGTTTLGRIRAFWQGLVLFGTSPLLYFSLACCVTVLLSQPRSRHARVLSWLTAWFALETILSSTSGYRWDHYYLLWILPLALIMMLAGSVLFTRESTSILPVILAITLMLALFNQAAINVFRAWAYPRAEDRALTLVRTYVQKGDEVTTWGHFDHDLWFDLDHRPGTRWFHEGAYTNRKIYREIVSTFLSDLERNRPRVVMERRSIVPLFAHRQLDEPFNEAFPPKYFEDWDDSGLEARKAALAEHYYPVAEQSGIVVYLRRE